MKKLILIFFILISGNLASYSNELSQENFIDKTLALCVEKNQLTAGQNKCIDEAKKEWNHELDKYYQLLLNKFSKNTRSALIKSQRNWLKFKEVELNLINEMYKARQATMYLTMQEYEEIRLIKDRALTLKNYYNKEIQFNN